MMGWMSCVVWLLWLISGPNSAFCQPVVEQLSGFSPNTVNQNAEGDGQTPEICPVNGKRHSDVIDDVGSVTRVCHKCRQRKPLDSVGMFSPVSFSSPQITNHKQDNPAPELKQGKTHSIREASVAAATLLSWSGPPKSTL